MNDSDGYIVVIPYCNYEIPMTFKNGLDYLKDEDRKQADGLVGYDFNGGIKYNKNIECKKSTLDIK